MPEKSEKDLYPVILQSAFGTSAPFLPTPRPEERTLLFGKCQWTQGYSPDNADSPLVKSFGMSHGLVIFGLFKFFQDNGLTKQTPVNVGFSGLAKILQIGKGGKSVKEVQRLLYDLASVWNKAVYPDGTIEEFKILDFTTTQTKNGEKKLKTVCFSNGFITMLEKYDEDSIFTLLYRVTCEMSSNVAKAIYVQFTDKVLKMENKADHFTEKAPWKKNISDLLLEMKQAVPKYKSQRAQIFTRPQGKNGSVIDQLDGVPIQREDIILHAKLEENSAKNDYNLCLWCERIKKKSQDEKKESATLAWWLQSGRSEEEYRERLKGFRPLNGKILEDLDLIGYPVKENRRFLEVANKLLNPGELEELVADCKARILTEYSISDIRFYLAASIRNGIINRSIAERVLEIYGAGEEDE